MYFGFHFVSGLEIWKFDNDIIHSVYGLSVFFEFFSGDIQTHQEFKLFFVFLVGFLEDGDGLLVVPRSALGDANPAIENHGI